jgi:hypothetical protein
MPDPGRNAYRGFEYQIRVTVWLSISFFEPGGVDTIVIEPLGGEDLHALELASDLDTGERDIRLRAGNIDVQVNSRQADAWGNADLKEILQGKKNTTGSTTREWPRTRRLRADNSLRFLFVTDASVKAERHSHEVVLTEGVRRRSPPTRTSGLALACVSATIGGGVRYR